MLWQCAAQLGLHDKASLAAFGAAALGRFQSFAILQ